MHTAIRIITHRGLDPSLPDHPKESTREAFSNQLKRGYGLEFDIRVTKDNQLVVIHDADLRRHTNGKDTRLITEVTLKELITIQYDECHLISFASLLELIEQKQHVGSISAIHIKHGCQNKETLDLIISHLQSTDTSLYILFDVTPVTAKYLKDHLPNVQLAPSVAHSYDIERYNSAVGGTLISINEALEHRELFDWVWLDEWDRTGENSTTKALYTQESFLQLRNAGFLIALVTPELHRTSPHLLGGESHPDAATLEKLFTRMEEISSYKPDAVCTDYPDKFKSLQDPYVNH